MVRIGSADKPRLLNEDELESVRRVLGRVSRRAARSAYAIARRYGFLSQRDPEHEVLTHQLSVVTQKWARQVYRLGGQPIELWTVVLFTTTGTTQLRFCPTTGDLQETDTQPPASPPDPQAHRTRSSFR